MKIYISIGRGKKINKCVKDHDLGWGLAPDNCSNPGDLSYFHDNGKFHAEVHQKPWTPNPFKILMKKYPNYDFVVIPDVPQINPTKDRVIGRKLALLSIRESINYIDKIPGPAYFAVQDWMMQSDITPLIERVDGLFVGGSLEWKIKTAFDWSNLAHAYKKKCHVGRVNQYETLRYMHYCGIDSVDGSTASRHDDPKEIEKYFNHLKYQRQL
jgi:hypothetical protein